MTAHLVVGRADLATALRLFRKFLRAKVRTDEALLTYEERHLTLELGGMATSVRAAGEWRGKARVPGWFIRNFARLLPEADPIHLEVRDGKFFLENTSTSCAWQDLGCEPIELPMDPPLSAVLHVAFTREEDEIANSGLTATVERALKRRDLLVSRAAEILAPLDVQERDLVGIVEECIRRRYDDPKSG